MPFSTRTKWPKRAFRPCDPRNQNFIWWWWRFCFTEATLLLEFSRLTTGPENGNAGEPEIHCTRDFCDGRGGIGFSSSWILDICLLHGLRWYCTSTIQSGTAARSRSWKSGDAWYYHTLNVKCKELNSWQSQCLWPRRPCKLGQISLGAFGLQYIQAGMESGTYEWKLSFESPVRCSDINTFPILFFTQRIKLQGEEESGTRLKGGYRKISSKRLILT